SHEIQIHNDTGVSWTKVDVTTTCACLHFTWERSTVPDGGDLVGTASVDARGARQGHQSQSVLVRIAPQHLLFVAPFSANVIPSSYLEPSSLSLRTGVSQMQSADAVLVIPAATDEQISARLARTEGAITVSLGAPQRTMSEVRIPVHCSNQNLASV